MSAVFMRRSHNQLRARKIDHAIANWLFEAP